MKRPKRKEPVFTADGLWRLLQIVLLLVAAHYIYQGLETIIKPPIREVFVATGLVERKNLPPLHLRDQQLHGAQWRPDGEQSSRRD